MIKFWPSCAPRKGVCGGAKFLSLPYYSQRAVFVSPASAFSSFIYLSCYWHFHICVVCCLLLLHSESVIHGFVDDYTFMVRACLDMYESLHDECWLEWAVTLQDIQDALFWDEKDSAYFTTTLDDPSVILRLKEGLH